MCGLAGFCVDPSNSSLDLDTIVQKLGAQVSRRGPDSSGYWTDRTTGYAVSHQRLAVLDISEQGHQPMVSRTGRYVIAFNGEIYNHLELRRELNQSENISWSGCSDTETLLALIEVHGIEKALCQCTGMWSIALYDTHNNLLHLITDRFGEKPLYWGISGAGSNKALIFSSDLSPFHSFPGFSNSISIKALSLFLQYSYVPSPLSIYEGIQKLPPASLLSIQLDTLFSAPFLPKQWWSVLDQITDSISNPYEDEQSALMNLEDILTKSVMQQSISDVPLGTFLSGGIDSSLITALLQANSSRPINTFTIGFSNSSYDESSFASAVATHLGTTHHEVHVDSQLVSEVIQAIPQIYSEPFADSSQIPTHLICKAARNGGLTVALTGDAGDELFCGYNRYLWAPKLWNQIRPLPRFIRSLLGDVLCGVPSSSYRYLESLLSTNQLGQKIHKLGTRLTSVQSIDQLYFSLVSQWPSAAHLIQQPLLDDSRAISEYPLPALLADDPIGRMMAWDTLSYLPDDILVKVDRAAMHCGLETRVPFLNHHVFSAAWKVPTSTKIKSNITKWHLRSILYKYVPQRLIDRPKSGFGVPVGEWLRGPLRDWADHLLNSDRLLKEGFLNPEPVSHLWQEHLSGRFDHTTRLWPILMWQSWYEYWHS